MDSTMPRAFIEVVPPARGEAPTVPTHQVSMHQSILIVGATSRTGLLCAKTFALECGPEVDVYAFCADARTLTSEETNLFDAIMEGNVRSSTDLEESIESTGADCVVFCMDSVDLSTNRPSVDGQVPSKTSNAHTLVRILRKERYHNIRTVVVSSSSSSPTNGERGPGDTHEPATPIYNESHERAFEAIADRTTIIRYNTLDSTFSILKSSIPRVERSSAILSIDTIANLSASISSQSNKAARSRSRSTSLRGFKRLHLDLARRILQEVLFSRNEGKIVYVHGRTIQ